MVSGSHQSTSTSIISFCRHSCTPGSILRDPMFPRQQLSTSHSACLTTKCQQQSPGTNPRDGPSLASQSLLPQAAHEALLSSSFSRKAPGNSQWGTCHTYLIPSIWGLSWIGHPLPGLGHHWLPKPLTPVTCQLSLRLMLEFLVSLFICQNSPNGGPMKREEGIHWRACTVFMSLSHSILKSTGNAGVVSARCTRRSRLRRVGWLAPSLPDAEAPSLPALGIPRGAQRPPHYRAGSFTNDSCSPYPIFLFVIQFVPKVKQFTDGKKSPDTLVKIKETPQINSCVQPCLTWRNSTAGPERAKPQDPPLLSFW